MKKLTLLCLVSFLALNISFAQNPTAPPTTVKMGQPDSGKIWTIHGENSLLINQNTFSNWAGGGQSSMAGTVLLTYDFNYKKDKWHWDSKAIIGFGENKQENQGWVKTDDRIFLASTAGYAFAKYWFYTFFLSIQTQFAKGYSYAPDGTATLISDFFAPAYFTFGPGISYKRSDDLKFNLSPLASRVIIVKNDSLASIGAFGVDPGDNSRYEFGANFTAYYKFILAKNITVENILLLYSNYLEKPGDIYTDYTLNLTMKVNELVTANFGFQMIYDDRAKIPEYSGNTIVSYGPKLQIKELFGAGLTYKF